MVELSYTKSPQRMAFQFTRVSAVQLAKALLPMLVTPSGMVTCVRAVHL